MSIAANICSVSGGKDSGATLILAMTRETENLGAGFADTGNENPITLDYVDQLEHVTGVKIDRVKADFTEQIQLKRKTVETKWRSEGVSESIIEGALNVLQPTGNPFLDMCLWKGRFPSTRARFCTDELKRKPFQEQIIEPLLGSVNAVITWVGVRHDESPDRAKLVEHDVEFGSWNPQQGILIYRPILQLTADDVFKLHRKHGIAWNPLYEQGMGRVGCMPCVNARKEEIREIAKRFPEEFDRIREWEHLVSLASKRSSSTFFYALLDPTASEDDYITPETHGIDRVIEWSKTARGGRQYDLIASDSTKQCSSIYGLCG